MNQYEPGKHQLGCLPAARPLTGQELSTVFAAAEEEPPGTCTMTLRLKGNARHAGNLSPSKDNRELLSPAPETADYHTNAFRPRESTAKLMQTPKINRDGFKSLSKPQKLTSSFKSLSIGHFSLSSICALSWYQTCKQFSVF